MKSGRKSLFHGLFAAGAKAGRNSKPVRLRLKCKMKNTDPDMGGCGGGRHT